MAYAGNIIGSNRAGNIGIMPMMTPKGWFAPMGVRLKGTESYHADASEKYF